MRKCKKTGRLNFAKTQAFRAWVAFGILPAAIHKFNGSQITTSNGFHYSQIWFTWIRIPIIFNRGCSKFNVY